MNILFNRKIWFTFSGILIAISIGSLALWGFRPSIDFTGGTLLEYRFKETVSAGDLIADIKSVITDADPVAQTSDAGTMIVRLPSVDEATHAKITARVLQARAGTEERFETIGPVVGVELRNSAITSLIITFIGILIYIAIAFRRVTRPVSSWVYGAITIATAFHDVIIPIGLFAILGRFAHVEIGGAFVAAMLTIMGYSINDTIVVLDRVRENLLRTEGTFEEIVRRAVRQSLARSLNTTITTLLALVAVFFFGGESLRYFALALIAGIATGAYSSLFIAAPMLIVWNKRKGGK